MTSEIKKENCDDDQCENLIRSRIQEIDKKLVRQKRINRYLILALLAPLIIAGSDVEFIKKAWAWTTANALMNTTQSGWFLTKNQNTSGTTWAIDGESTYGSGIYGISWAGKKAGLYGYNGSTTGNGTGVTGVSMGPVDSPLGLTTSGRSAGVYGELNGTLTNAYNTPTGAGVYGTSTNATGVYGESTEWIGVQGISTNKEGVFGSSKYSVGIRGTSESTSLYGGSAGILGFSQTTFGGVFESRPSRGQILLRQTSGQSSGNRSTSCQEGELRSEDVGENSRLFYCEGGNHWKIVILGDP